MRCPWWIALVAFVMLATGARWPFGVARGKASAPPRPAGRVSNLSGASKSEIQVVGFGRTMGDARDNALERAQARVVELLRERFGKPDWQPPAEVLEAGKLLQADVLKPLGEDGVPGAERIEEVEKTVASTVWAWSSPRFTVADSSLALCVASSPLITQVKRVRYEVVLTEKYVAEMEPVVRQQRMQERQLVLFRGLAGLVAILLVTAAYLRLEEMTKGYATKLLRLGGAVVLALVAAGLWLTW